MLVQEHEISLFREVVSIARKHQVYFWLDQGSLLGAVRDGAFLPWDHDIDLGMILEPGQAKALARDLVMLGATVERYPYVLRVMRRHKDEKTIDLRIYTLQGDQAVTQLRAVNLGSKTLAHRVALKLVRMGQRQSSKARRFCLSQQRKSCGLVYWLWEWLFLFSDLAGQFSDKFRQSFRQRIVDFKVPAYYFQKLDSITVYGMNLPTPSNREAYLEMKYKKDWRVPNKDWKYWRDDGALVKPAHKD